MNDQTSKSRRLHLEQFLTSIAPVVLLAIAGIFSGLGARASTIEPEGKTNLPRLEASTQISPTTPSEIASDPETTAANPASENQEIGTLRAVTIITRHSAISPKYSLPNNPISWDIGKSQLTALGVFDMYNKGQWLRQKYIDREQLIGRNYHTSTLYVRSSSTDRALQSAQVMMLGMFPLGTGQTPQSYDPSSPSLPGLYLAFTPVPVHSVALENDNLLRPWTKQANCRKYRNFVKGLAQSEAYQKKAAEYAPFLQKIADITGFNAGEEPAKILYEINKIYEPLSAQMIHKIPIELEISEEDLQLLSDLSDWNYHQQFLGKGIGRITGGPFLQEVVNNLNGFVESGGKKRKLHLYSAHQRTLLGIQAALGIESFHAKAPLYRGRVPALASHYAFELRELSPNTYAVQLKFVSGINGKEQVIPIPGCSGYLCSLEQFKKLTAEVIPQDWQSECNAPSL